MAAGARCGGHSRWQPALGVQATRRDGSWRSACGSLAARKGLAIETRSAWPLLRIFSAISCSHEVCPVLIAINIPLLQVHVVGEDGWEGGGEVGGTRAGRVTGHSRGLATGVLILLVATNGTETLPISLPVTHEKAPRGTYAHGTRAMPRPASRESKLHEA